MLPNSFIFELEFVYPFILVLYPKLRSSILLIGRWQKSYTFKLRLFLLQKCIYPFQTVLCCKAPGKEVYFFFKTSFNFLIFINHFLCLPHANTPAKSLCASKARDNAEINSVY